MWQVIINGWDICLFFCFLLKFLSFRCFSNLTVLSTFTFKLQTNVILVINFGVYRICADHHILVNMLKLCYRLIFFQVLFLLYCNNHILCSSIVLLPQLTLTKVLPTVSVWYDHFQQLSNLSHKKPLLTQPLTPLTLIKPAS